MPFNPDFLFDFTVASTGSPPDSVVPAHPGQVVTVLVFVPPSQTLNLKLPDPLRVVLQTQPVVSQGVASWLYAFYVPEQAALSPVTFTFTPAGPVGGEEEPKHANGTIDVSANC
ncbi:hypothetical protein D7W79_32985 [Corallococcus exercitus]|uniref:Uncharacterized protein n=1 Tax=Corallococcus exercitus TaxID=2316736 RepID=A0A3A8HGB6_9BACT|nr:hypothetical protein [Corallococcus exercitus]NOK31950.1 hypothetical protein [Corallococcus exercitus]RKG69466.1 hypothetical protein D7W79_32985 [Corallococcus exercitus]